MADREMFEKINAGFVCFLYSSGEPDFKRNPAMMMHDRMSFYANPHIAEALLYLLTMLFSPIRAGSSMSNEIVSNCHGFEQVR